MQMVVTQMVDINQCKERRKLLVVGHWPLMPVDVVNRWHWMWMVDVKQSKDRKETYLQ